MNFILRKSVTKQLVLSSYEGEETIDSFFKKAVKHLDGDMRNLDWTGCCGFNLMNFDLSGMDFSGCSFNSLILRNCNLKNANFKNCIIFNALEVNKCQTSGLDFSDCQIGSVRKSYFKGTDFSSTQIRSGFSSSFHSSCFKNSSLFILKSVIFDSCNISDSSWGGVFENSNFIDCDFNGLCIDRRKQGTFSVGVDFKKCKIYYRCRENNNFTYITSNGLKVEIPFIENLNKKVFETIKNEELSLDMTDWRLRKGLSMVNPCKTTYCWAGAIIKIALDESKELRSAINEERLYASEIMLPSTLAVFIMLRSNALPSISHIPDFFTSNDKALIEIERFAKY